VSQKPKHSPVGASGRSRWSRCPGSVKMSEGQPNTAGLAAKEGTAAHEFIGLAMERALAENRPTRDVVADAVKAMHVYTDYCESLCKPGVITHVEHRFDMSNQVIEGAFGTGDFIAYDPATQWLDVVDYKNGEALVIEAKGNLQTEYYGLGIIATLGYNPKWVRMTIVQPRAYHPDGPIRHWVVPSLYFLEVETAIISEIKATRVKKPLLASGDQCQFCSGKIICPQRAKDAVGDAKNEFTPVGKKMKKQHGFYTNPVNDFEPVTDNNAKALSTSSLFD